MYLRCTYQVKTEISKLGDSCKQQNTLSSTRNNLRRSQNESQLRDIPRSKSKGRKIPDPVIEEEEEEKYEFEKEMLSS